KLAAVRHPSELADIHYVRQGDPKGLGHAVLKGRQHVGDEPFAVLLGDDLIDERSPILPKMIEVAERTGGSVVALMEVPPEAIHLYGCAAVEATDDDEVVRVTGLVEKPANGEAPSNLAVIGRYVLAPEIFDVLETTGPGHGGYGVVFKGARYDTGDKLDYLKAVVQIACDREDLGEDLKGWLKGYVPTLD